MSEKVEIVAELKDLISGKFADINKQIDAMDGKLSKLNDTGSGKGIMGQVLGANLLTGAITKAGRAIFDFGIDSAKAYGQSEQFLTSLKTMFHGNAEEAKSLDKQLKSFAIQTPFELGEIRDATKMMVAYGSTSGGVVEEMRMLGDISSGVGSSLSEMAYLYGTLRTQGRAFSKDIYQFTGRGVPIIKELAKQFGVADSQVMKLVEDGKVGFAQVEKAMRSMTSEGGQFSGMMQEQSKTLLGQTSNLADAWDQLKTAIGLSQSGILKSTVSWATSMVSAIKEIVDKDNYREETRKGLPKGMDLNTNLGSYSSEKDDRFIAYEKWGKHERTTIFKTLAEQQKFQLENKSGVVLKTGDRETTQSQYYKFSKKMFEMSESATAKNAQEKLNELFFMRREITSKSKSGEMSNVLAVNELAQISANTKQLQELLRSADVEKKKQDAKEPAKLEEVAKKNKAVQVIVNIENLVRELTNVNQNATNLNKLTTDGTLQALTIAVNNIYSAGQV